MLLVLSIILFVSPLAVAAGELTAAQITERVDTTLNAFKDQTLKVKMILTDKDGSEEVREFMMMQKGPDKRLGKFLAPASQKGIAFLSLPNDTFYLYLPAFKKTRRIASHLKNTKFAGTDFTYENLEAKRYGKEWEPKLLKKEDLFYLLELTPKPETKTEYGKLLIQVRKDNFYPSKVEFFDKNNNVTKVMTNEKIEMVNGYLIAREIAMTDLKTGHKTKMILEEVKFDTGLSDEQFTERYLSR